MIQCHARQNLLFFSEKNYYYKVIWTCFTNKKLFHNFRRDIIFNLNYFESQRLVSLHKIPQFELILWKGTVFAQFRGIRSKLFENFAFPQNFHTKKLGQITVFLHAYLETVVQRCSVKMVFLEISQKSQENISARVSFLTKSLY